MLEAGSLNAVLKPSAYIGRIDIAEYEMERRLATELGALRSEGPVVHGHLEVSCRVFTED
jgi:hypothetical protein